MSGFSKQAGMVLLVGSALAPLGAQELQEALRLLPPSTATLEIYKHPAQLNQRAAKTERRLSGSSSPFVTALPELNLDLTTLDKSFMVVAQFPHVDPKDNRQAILFPTKDFPALVKGFKAVKTSGRYAFTRGKARFTLARYGHFAAISRDPELLRELQGQGSNLAVELAPLLPWIDTHDTVVVAPTGSVKRGLQTLRSACTAKPGAPANALAGMNLLLPLLDQAETSVTQAAVALDFPADGSARFSAKLFLAPGATLGQASQETPARPTMAGLPAEGFVLGASWSNSGPLRTFLDKIISHSAQAMPGADPDQAAKSVALGRALNAQIQGQTMSLGLPAQAGDPLLGRFRLLTQVADPATYLEAWTAWMAQQIQAKLLLPTLDLSLAKEVLPGVPSATLTLAIKGSQPLPLPPAQRKMAFMLLFGQPDRISFSLAQLDSHTVVGVLGGAEELKAALVPVAPTLDQDPNFQAGEALLTGPACLRYYVSVAGVGALVQQVLEGFSPAAAQHLMAPLPAAPPLTVALVSDPMGLEVVGAASETTLDALGALVRSLKQFKPQQPALAPGAHGK